MRWDNAMSTSTVLRFEKFNYAHSHMMRQLCARLCVTATEHFNVVVRGRTSFGLFCLNIAKQICAGYIDEITRCVAIVDKMSTCVMDVEIWYVHGTLHFR